MDISFTPTGGTVESTAVESKSVETQSANTAETKPSYNESAEKHIVEYPSTQPVPSHSESHAEYSSSSSSSSDDYDSDFFSSDNNGSDFGGGDVKNSIGLRFGVCNSKITSYGVSSGRIVGFTFGVVDQIWFGERSVFVEPGLFFNQKGYTLQKFEPSETKVYYLELPVMICYRQGRETLSMTYKAGGYLGCGVKGTLKTKISDSPAASDIFKSENEFDLFKEGAIGRFDAGVKFGVDFVIRKVQIGFTYDMGLYKIDKKDIIYGDDELMLGYKQLKNRSFQILAGFNF